MVTRATRHAPGLTPRGPVAPQTLPTRRGLAMRAGRLPDDCRAALEAAGWATSFRVAFYMNTQTWVGRAVKGDQAAEGQGPTAREAWRATYEAAGTPPPPS